MKKEFKASIIETLLNKAFVLFRGDQFRGIVERFVRRNYAKGMESEEVKLKLRTNAVPEDRKIEIMTDQVSSEVGGVMDDLNRQLQESVRDGIMNNENPTQLKKRVQLLLNPTEKRKHEFASGRKMNWSDRIDLITRTEANRAQNQGRRDTFEQSGLPDGHKWISIHPDERLCPICSKAGNKYDKESAIPIDNEFVVSVPRQGIFRFQLPPIHPNCRCRAMFTVGKPKKEE